jgi:hypothetical protein
MIHVCLESCPAGVEGLLAELATYQAALDACGSYAERVRAVDAHWNSRRNNKPVQVVREMLLAMCTGLGRCMYCEDSRARDVEHVWPKILYPGLVFAWANFLYACSSCNGPKGARFMVVLPDGRIVDVGRKKGAPPPEQLAANDPLLIGAPLLIDPRSEDPLDLLHLDLATGVFDEAHKTGLRYERAHFTVELLGLNEREYLVEARQSAYHTAESVLRDYASLKREGAGPERLGPKRQAILRQSHRTVWEEMKRQRTSLPGIRALFEGAPEALGW